MLGRIVQFIIAAVFCVVSSQVSIAQTKPKQKPTVEESVETPEKTVEKSISTLPPAYEDQMLELAEILGSLHYLRELCKSNEGQIWRDQMRGMIDAEEPTKGRRASLIAHFNRGFRGYREIYTECTHVAAEAANRHLKKGVRLAFDIPNRYGK